MGKTNKRPLPRKLHALFVSNLFLPHFIGMCIWQLNILSYLFFYFLAAFKGRLDYLGVEGESRTLRLSNGVERLSRKFTEFSRAVSSY